MKPGGRRVTVMGLGRHGGGAAAARHCAALGDEVTVTDLADADALRQSLAELADAPIHCYRLGGHREEDFCNADLLVVNPAVRLDSPLVELARSRGAAVTSEIELFLRACPARVVGVTGTNGKSTTASMLAAILRAAGRRTWLGGNLGGSLLPDLPDMTADDLVVLELSSFQLAWLHDDAPRPSLAVVTNCAPNHLDWHGDWESYRAAKRRIFHPTGVAVLNPRDLFVAEVARLPAAFPGAAGSLATSATRAINPRVVPAADPADVPPPGVPGEYNRENAALAVAAARVLDCSWNAIERALADYRGLPHRLEWIAEVAGRRFYDDSAATTPESVVAALRALDRPTWLLAGGKAKGADYAGMAETIARAARGACFYGAAGEMLFDMVARVGKPPVKSLLHRAATLPEALAWCWRQSRPGDAILLSPACASYDQFRDYRHRAAVFRAAVAALRQESDEK